MHILIIPSWYRTKENPIYGSFFAEQSEVLAKSGHRVSVLPYYADAKKRWRVDVLERKEYGDLTEYALHYKRVRFHLTFFRIVFAMLWILRHDLKGSRPDIIHVHSFQATVYARALRAFTGIPYVVTEHATWFERGILSEKEKKTARRGFACADGVCAVSTGLRNVLRSSYCDKEIRVIPNLVADRFFEGGLRKGPEKPFRFICVGTLEHKKGQDLLIRAFARVAAVEPDVFLTIIGDGPYRESLPQWASEQGVAEKTEMTGILPREEVAARLRESRAFVLPSRSETFGVVFIEAMACGLPIVMTKTNAWELLVSEDTGIAVEIDDEDALTEAMLRVIRDYGSYDPQKIRRFCEERFSAHGVAEQLTDWYTEVLSKKGRTVK